MRITFILPGYCLRPVGGARVVYQYANQLVYRGHEVSIIHPRYMNNRQSGVVGKLLAQGARLYKYFKKPEIKWQYVDPRVKRLYVPEPTAKHIPDADVVFATAWQTAEYVFSYPPSKGKKYYLIQHYEAAVGNKERVEKTWKEAFKKIVIAKWLLQKGLEMGIPKEEMVYVPNGIDTKAFYLITPIEKRKPCVCMMHQRVRFKGSRDGLLALDLARRQFPGLEAIVFGRDLRPFYVPKWIKYRRFPSHDELVRDIYNQSRLYLCPSWTEGAPAPPAEAMACGCALVSTNCTGIDEYAKEGETALLSPIKDPAALAKNILRLLDDDKLRVKIAKNGYEKIQECTWEKSADLLEKYIKA